MIAVGDGALVLHPGIRHLHQLVTVTNERVLSDVLMEDLQHGPCLRKLCLRLVQVFRLRVKIES